jgi:hypothetical protein
MHPAHLKNTCNPDAYAVFFADLRCIFLSSLAKTPVFNGLRYFYVKQKACFLPAHTSCAAHNFFIECLHFGAADSALAFFFLPKPDKWRI